jgi:hypothetical protein
VKKVFALLLSTSLIFESSVALATTPKLPPRLMTIGLLQILCKKDGKNADPSDRASLAYCQGYLNGVIDSYFERTILKRSDNKRNVCLLFSSNDWLRDEIRNDILAITEERLLNLEYGLSAEPWLRNRLAAKCEPKK